MNETIRLLLQNLENDIKLLKIQLGESDPTISDSPNIMPITDLFKIMNNEDYVEPEYYEEP